MAENTRGIVSKHEGRTFTVIGAQCRVRPDIRREHALQMMIPSQ